MGREGGSGDGKWRDGERRDGKERWQEDISLFTSQALTWLDLDMFSARWMVLSVSCESIDGAN